MAESPYTFLNPDAGMLVPPPAPDENPPVFVDEDGVPIPGTVPPGTGDFLDNVPSASDIIRGMFATQDTGGGGGRGRGRRATLTDDLNEAGARFAGQTWDSMSTAQRNAFQRFFGTLDSQSIQKFGKSYRSLSADQRGVLAEEMAALGIQPQVLPQDMPGATAMNNLLVKQPAPLKAPATSAPSSLPSWQTISSIISPSDLASLTSAWQGGSLGTGAVNGTRLNRYMAMFPGSGTPYAFINALRNAWASSGAATSRQRATPTVSIRSVGTGSSPRPPRYSRSTVSSLTPPPQGGQNVNPA